MSNGLLAICKFILFRWIEIKAGAVQFRCKDVVYATFDELQNAFRSGTVYPNELKQAVTPLLEQMLGPIRAMITDEAQEGTRLLLRAYPEVGDTRKKEAQLAAARAKGPTTFAAANVVVGVIVDEPQPQDGAAPGVRRCTVDLGAGERLVVISPLVPATDAKGRRVAVLRNHGAKLYHVVGTETQVRLLYVLAKDGTTKHLITPPADAAPGELIACDGVDGEPVEELARNWSKVAAKLATNADGVPCWDGVPMNVSGVPLLASEHKECAIECDEREKPTKAEKPAAAAAAATSSSAASSSTSTKKGGKAAAPAEEKPLDVSRLQLLVGKIVDVEVHAEADSLYVEKIDLGEASGPRTVVSGLRKHIPIEQMRDRLVIVVANLKPSNLKGIKSFGMVLCGANADRSVIEFVDPPAGSKVGEPIVCDGFVGHARRSCRREEGEQRMDGRHARPAMQRRRRGHVQGRCAQDVGGRVQVRNTHRLPNQLRNSWRISLFFFCFVCLCCFFKSSSQRHRRRHRRHRRHRYCYCCWYCYCQWAQSQQRRWWAH
jgi:methionine--tRNA ligase beta chain